MLKKHLSDEDVEQFKDILSYNVQAARAKVMEKSENESMIIARNHLDIDEGSCGATKGDNQLLLLIGQIL